MALSPRTYGASAVADRLLAGRRVLWIGDSITYRNAHTLMRYAAEAKQAGFVSSPSSGAGATADAAWTYTANYTAVTEFVATQDVLRLSKVAFVTEGPSPAGSDVLVQENNVLAKCAFGPSELAGQTIPTVAKHQQIFGRNWISEMLTAGHDVRIRVPVWMHPDGNPNASVWFQMTNDSDTVYGESAFFATYAASAHWDFVDVTIPAATNPAMTGMRLWLRHKAGTAVDNGTQIIFSKHLTCDCLDDPTGMILFNFGIPSQRVNDWNDAAKFGNEVFDFMRLLAGETSTVLIMLGQNTTDPGTAAGHKAQLETLVGRVNSDAVARDVVLLANYGNTSKNGGGEEEPEQYFVTGAYDAVVANPTWLFLNLHRALPYFTALQGDFSVNWSQCGSGAQFYVGDCVVDDAAGGGDGNLYVCKANVLKLSTHPKDAATYWTLVVSGAGLQDFWATARNRNSFLADSEHPNWAGHQVMAHAIWGLVREVAAKSDAEDAQYVEDAAAVTAVADKISDEVTDLLGVAGTLDVAALEQAAADAKESEIVADIEAAKASFGGTVQGVTGTAELKEQSVTVNGVLVGKAQM
jgi:hypothetical protein